MDQDGYREVPAPQYVAEFAAARLRLSRDMRDGRTAKPPLESAAFRGVRRGATEHLNPVFALCCQCGGNRHYFHCYRWANPDSDGAVATLSPLVLECAACGKKTDLFDSDVHGYDVELGHRPCTVRAQGNPTVFECPSCGRQAFEAFVRFGYPEDLFDGDEPEFAGREQDLFDWFHLIGKCMKCAQAVEVADFECA